MEVRAIGIDLGKSMFHFVAVDARGLIGMEAGGRSSLSRPPFARPRARRSARARAARAAVREVEQQERHP